MDRRTLLARLIAGVTYTRVAGAQSARPLKDTVADAERAFADSMAKRDLAAFTARVSQEAVFFGGPDGNTPTRGRAAIVSEWKRFFDGPTAPFSWSPDTSEVIDSGTLGITSGPVRNARGDVTGRFNSVWRLEADGQWRVVFDKGCQACR
jgi:ketosteroid isomerase-like protein